MTSKPPWVCVRFCILLILIAGGEALEGAESAAPDVASNRVPSARSPELASFAFSPKKDPAKPLLAPAVWSESPTLLPKLTVTEDALRFSETEVLTEKGLVEFAKNKYTTPLYRVTFGPLAQLGAYYFNFLAILGGWHPNKAEAMALYREDERVRIATEVDSLVNLVETLDPKGDHADLKRLRYDVRQQGIQAMYWNPFTKH